MSGKLTAIKEDGMASSPTSATNSEGYLRPSAKTLLRMTSQENCRFKIMRPGPKHIEIDLPPLGLFSESSVFFLVSFAGAMIAAIIVSVSCISETEKTYHYRQPTALLLWLFALWMGICISYRVFLYETVVISQNEYSIRRDWHLKAPKIRFWDLEDGQSHRISWLGRHTLQQVRGKTEDLDGIKLLDMSGNEGRMGRTKLVLLDGGMQYSIGYFLSDEEFNVLECEIHRVLTRDDPGPSTSRGVPSSSSGEVIA